MPFSRRFEMLRHIVSALFFVLLSFLMVQPTASTTEIDKMPLLQKQWDQTTWLEETLWPGAQCHQNVGPMVLSLKDLDSERLYCAVENELNQQRWSWSDEQGHQNTMSSL